MAKSRKRDQTGQAEGGRVVSETWDQRGGRQPYLVIGVFLVLTLVLFGDFLFSNGMLYGSDTIPSGIFFRGLYRDHVREFYSMPMWDRYILGGLPFVDAMHGDTFYPTAILQFLLPLHRALGYKLILHVFLAGVGMHLFLQVLGLRRSAALLGSLSYMFAPTFVTFVFAGHDAKMYAIALLPFQFYFLERGFRERSLNCFLLLGGVTGLSILSSHNQMAYFALWGVGLYFLYHFYFLIRESKNEAQEPFKEIGKMGLFFGIALVTALAIGAVQLLPSYTYVQNYSVRGTAEKTSFEHATSYSLHPEEIASLIVPEFGGYTNKGGTTYWGRNPLKYNSEYAGIVPLVFAAIALALRRDRRVWFFLGGGILALAYALTYHTPLFRICYEILPGVKNFRSQGMIAFLYAFCLCTLGAMGLHQIQEPEKAQQKQHVFRILRITGMIALIGGVLGVVFTRSLLDLWQGIFYRDITVEKRQILDMAYPGIQTGFTICLAVALVGVGLAWAKVKGRISELALILGLGGIILLDTWRIDRQFIQIVAPEAQPGFRTNELITTLQQRQKQEGPFRVLDLTNPQLYYPNELGAHQIETVDGFHDNELQWYRRFRGERDEHLIRGLSLGADGQLKGAETNAFLNLLNVRYILYRFGNQVQFFSNPGSLNRAFIASSYEVLRSPSKILERLSGQSSDFDKVVLLEENPHWGEIPSGEGAAGTVQSLQYVGDQAKVVVQMKRRGILVLCDNYFPYWKATDNGREIPVVRAYSTFRALLIEAGDHEIQLTYDSTPYHRGKWISLFSILGISIIYYWPKKIQATFSKTVRWITFVRRK